MPLMAPSPFAAMDCSIARTLDVVGERWTMLILRDAFYGIRRFDDFQRNLGIARNVLADRLAKLVDRGVLRKEQYEERPPRHEYRLTEKGRDLFRVLLAMAHWGDRWESEGDPLVTVTHHDCGEQIDVQPACSHCGGTLTPWNVTVEPMPVGV